MISIADLHKREAAIGMYLVALLVLVVGPMPASAQTIQPELTFWPPGG